MTLEGNPAPATGFTVGRAIAITFLVLFSNIVRFAAIMLIVGVPAIALFILGSMFTGADVTAGSGIALQFSQPTILSTLLILSLMVCTGLGYLLAVSALIH